MRMAAATQLWLRGEATAAEVEEIVAIDSCIGWSAAGRPVAVFSRTAVECTALLTDGRPGKMHDLIPVIVSCAADLLGVQSLPAELRARHPHRRKAMAAARARLTDVVRAH